MTKGEQIAAGFADLVKKYDDQWKWFGTFTFKDDIHPEAAHKIWMKFIHQLNREIFGCGYWKRKSKGVIWARGSEYQIRGVLHYHALLGLIPDRVRRMNYVDYWEELAGFARIYAYERGKGAEGYISKSAYVFKRGEIDFSDTLVVQPLSNQVGLLFPAAVR
jgi:hypothetical protein